MTGKRVQNVGRKKKRATWLAKAGHHTAAGTTKFVGHGGEGPAPAKVQNPRPRETGPTNKKMVSKGAGGTPLRGGGCRQEVSRQIKPF